MLSVICHTTTSMKATTWHKHTLVDGQVVLYTTSVAGALTNSNSPHSKFECHQSYPVIYLPFKPVTPWSLNSLWDVSVFKAAYCAALVLSISTSSGSSWLHQPSVYSTNTSVSGDFSHYLEPSAGAFALSHHFAYSYFESMFPPYCNTVHMIFQTAHSVPINNETKNTHMSYSSLQP